MPFWHWQHEKACFQYGDKYVSKRLMMINKQRLFHCSSHYDLNAAEICGSVWKCNAKFVSKHHVGLQRDLCVSGDLPHVFMVLWPLYYYKFVIYICIYFPPWAVCCLLSTYSFRDYSFYFKIIGPLLCLIYLKMGCFIIWLIFHKL